MKTNYFYGPVGHVFYFVLFIFFAFTSCQKGATEPPPVSTSTVGLTVSVAEAAPYQHIRIQLPAGAKPQSLTESVVSVSLGTAKVDAYADSKAFAANEYAYYLVLPELAPGTQKIALAVAGGKVAEGSINITAFTKIDDVSNYIKIRQADAQKEISDAKVQYDAQVQAGHLRPATRDSLHTQMLQAYARNKEIVDALSESEKRIYVQMLEANKSWLASYKQVFVQNPLSNRRTAVVGDCEELRRQQEQYEAIGATAHANNARLAAEQCEAERARERVEATSEFSNKLKESFKAANEERKATPGRLSAAWAFVSTFVTEATKGMVETASGIVDLDDPFAVLEIKDTKEQKTAAQEFEIDKDYDYSAGLQLTNLNSQTATTFPGFAPMVQHINNFSTALTDFGQFLPVLPSVKIPEAKTQKLYVSGFTIDQVSDNRVQVEVKDGVKGKVLRFVLTTPVVEEKINLTFRVNYTSKFGNGSLLVPVTVLVPLNKMLIKASPFKITRWNSGGVDLFTMHEMWRWKCDLTEYINREQLLEASISFGADGTYTITEKYHEKYYDNPGNTCATVRFVDQVKTYTSSNVWSANNSTRTLSITFKDDQGNPVTITSPATIQNGTLSVAGGGVSLGMEKK